MEKLIAIIKAFRVSQRTKDTIMKMADLEEIEIQQMCRKILNAAAREFEDSKNSKKPGPSLKH